MNDAQAEALALCREIVGVIDDWSEEGTLSLTVVIMALCEAVTKAVILARASVGEEDAIVLAEMFVTLVCDALEEHGLNVRGRVMRRLAAPQLTTGIH